MEVSAPPVPRLFPRTLYGTSFWARFLFEHYACFRPVHRVAAWMSAQGLTVSPGTVEGEVSQELYWVDTLEEALKDDKKHAVQNSFDMPAGTIGSSSSTKGNGNWSPAPAYSTKRQSGLQSHFTSLSIIPVAK